MIMKKRTCLFTMITFLYVWGIFGQQLHHHMLSCQGGVSSTTQLKVLYTVGQQSVTGTSTNGYVVQQGFQQNFWNTRISENFNTIQVTAYPNPFIDKQSITFSSSPSEVVNVLIFDLLGRIVYSNSHSLENNTIILELKNLSSAEYLVTLSAPYYSHSLKISKQ